MITFKDIPNFVIDGDEKQLIVKERKTVETGKDAGKVNWVPVSYHTTLSQAIVALSRLLHRRKVSEHRQTLDTAVKSLQEIEQRIRAAGGEDGN